jgi:hypothetical protein
MAAKSVNKLPIEDDISLHKKGWIVQRVGWALMFAFIVAALMGLFGEGPMSGKKIKVGSINVEYERFCRYEHGMQIRLESAGENINTVSIPQTYLKSFRVSEIVPEPAKQVATAGYIQYQYDGSENNIINFFLTPVQRKNVEGIFQVNQHPFTIKQTIYP